MSIKNPMFNDSLLNSNQNKIPVTNPTIMISNQINNSS